MKTFNTSQEILSVLKEIFTIDQQLNGMEYLKTYVRKISQFLGVKYVIIGHAIEPENKSIQTDVVWAGDDFIDNFVYELAGTPCELVYTGNRVCVYPNSVASSFPEDLLLEKMGVESYFGSPILDSNGQLKGLLVLLDDQEIGKNNFYTEIIEFLSIRVGAELDRFYIEASLKKKVAERTQELELSNKELQAALSNVKKLSGLLPICGHCKKIRDDNGYWNQIDSYIQENSEAEFSHSICQDCAKKYYPDYDVYKG